MQQSLRRELLGPADAAGAFPIAPSTDMGEYWAEEKSKGHINVSGRPLIFVEPEGEHAAAAITAGMSMTGLRASLQLLPRVSLICTNRYIPPWASACTYVLNVACRAITKATLNVHCGH